MQKKKFKKKIGGKIFLGEKIFWGKHILGEKIFWGEKNFGKKNWGEFFFYGTPTTGSGTGTDTGKNIGGGDFFPGPPHRKWDQN